MMTSDNSHQLIILGEELRKKKLINLHPISKLYECSQITQVPFTIESRPGGSGDTFLYEIVYCGCSAQGSGSTKKEAKKVAAENLISKVLQYAKLEKEDRVECTTEEENETEETPEKCREDQISSWREIMSQLSHRETDCVVLLDIFALNTSTGSAKYQVTETLKENKKKVGYKVMITWNLFFMESEANTRVEAEKKAAVKMVNKIRELCDLEDIPEDNSHENVQEEEDDTTILNDEDIPEEIRTLLIKHEATLTSVDTSLSSVKKLESFSKRIQSPVLPNYSITNVVTEGCRVRVEVECSWLSLSSRGEANTRSAAEEEAASKMIRDTKNIINKLKKIQAKILPVLEKDSNPVEYLIYPSSKQRGGVTVTSNDYLCLQKGQFLNDVIIDFYLKYLQCGPMEENPLMCRTYIFSIYFYSRLITKGKVASAIPPAQLMHNNVKKWTKNVNIFEKDFIVIPINESDHWFVVIVCFPNPRESSKVKRSIMIIMDSLEDGRKTTVCNNIRTYLSMEWSAKMNTEKRFTVENCPAYCPNVLQQSNMTDCGIFLLQFVESFFEKPLTAFTPPLESLVSWFSEDCINSKRYKIASIIRDLSSESQSEKTAEFPSLDFGYSEPSESEDSNVSSEPSIDSMEAESNTKRSILDDEVEGEPKKLKEDSLSDPSIDWLEDY